MHGEQFIADNIIKVGYAVTGDQLIVRGIAKRRNQLDFAKSFFIFYFFTKSAYKNKFSGHMHNFFLL